MIAREIEENGYHSGKLTSPCPELTTGYLVYDSVYDGKLTPHLTP